MKVGLFAINMGPCSEPVTALRVAQAAEAAGFESVWTGEHIVLPDPDPEVPASPVPSGIGHQYGVSLLGVTMSVSAGDESPRCSHLPN